MSEQFFLGLNFYQFHHFLVICSLLSFATLRSLQIYRSNLKFNALDTFRVIAPSDLWTIGSFARYAILNNVHRGRYATERQKIMIEAMGRKYGCHHCGRRLFLSTSFKMMTKPIRKRWNYYAANYNNLSITDYVADHIPPSKLRRYKRKKQILLPQCKSCSIKQSHSVKLQQRTLVVHNLWSNMSLFHLWIPFPWIYHYYFNN